VDPSQGSLVLAQQNLERAKVQQSVRLRLGNCSTWILPNSPDVLVTNPPWGERLSGADGLSDGASVAESVLDTEGGGPVQAWQDLRDFMKRECGGAHCLRKVCEVALLM
jgi:23S rRNA G2445 N2-methylase RlmL